MKMSSPAATSALDENHQGLIGKPINRVDGRLKVTGAAPYSYEIRKPIGEGPNGDTAYGFILEASVAKGRITSMDTTAAERSPGVIHVMTHRNVPEQAPPGELKGDRFARAIPQFWGDGVVHYGAPVALVLAETFEQARSAARLIEVDYAEEAGEFVMADSLDKAIVPEPGNIEPDSDVGEFDEGFGSAAVSLDATYTTPFHIHAPMEPHASTAWWEGERVIVHCSAQLLESAQKAIAATLKMPLENVRAVSRFVGGGFGGKLPIYGDAILAALASRELRRPVKIALTRQQLFHVTTHRSQTIQRLRLGATKDGVLTAIGHESWSHSARLDNFFETSAGATRSLYAAPNRMTRHRSVKLDLPMACSTRAPGEAVGMLALENAMDEMAEKLGMDPVEFRIRNEPTVDPEKQLPYSTRQLVACLREGAQRFGWADRNHKPGQMRDGRWLIGHGMSAASRSDYLRPSKCKLSLGSDGRLAVRMSMTDIGTGSYTVLSQIAAEMMGLPVDQIDMLLGDSDFPPTAGSGGSFGAASSGSALFDACEKLREKLAHLADIDPLAASLADGSVRGLGRSVAFTTLAGENGIDAEGEIEPGDMNKQYSHQGYGAHFCEVGVDADTGEVRVRRMLGVFAAGRILNEKLARSQCMGGMIWGIGSALHEEGVVDGRSGQFVNHDLAEYHVPSHADVPHIDVVFLAEQDDKANPLRIKGVGELGICGAGAAVTNAIYNACGVRVRDYPVTLDKLISGMSDDI